VYTPADLAYIRAEFRTLEQLCAERASRAEDLRPLIEAGRLPRPSYVLDDGTWMFPPDYFRLVDEAGGPERLRAVFAERLAAAGAGDELEEHWQGYMSGTYGVCLREVTPEAMARKTSLVSSLCELLVLATPRDPGWRRRLREEVEELDSLEREFSPDYDRERFERPPTRDLLIAAARERFPDVFAEGECTEGPTTASGLAASSP
jgi:Family of unknown function (DUF6058)